MTLRVASLAFFLASAALAVTWLTLLPLIIQLLDALRRLAPAGSGEAELLMRVRSVLPFYLGANLVLLAVLFAVLLYFTLARPLGRLEVQINQLGQQRSELPLSASGGPLLSRVQSSLRRMSSALAEEQATTRRQLEELKAANERLGKAHAELAASERLATVGRLAAGIAHEVGNPLSGILGYLSLLRSRAGSDPQMLDFVDRVEAEVSRISEIVSGLLDLGRPPTLSPQPVELAKLVRTCVDLVSAGPDLRGRTVNASIPDGLVIQTDPGPLSQVLINLLINAGQALPDGGRVDIHAEATPDTLRLCVQDNGPGLPESMLGTTHFQPFFTTKPAGKGTGLGLAVSEHLVHMLGGTLSATNRPHGGASFTLALPMRR